MTDQLRLAELRGKGGYDDEYFDQYGAGEYADRIHIVPRKLRRSFALVPPENWLELSSIFQYFGDVPEEDDAIWAATAAVWANRNTYTTTEDFKAAIDAALDAAGYTAPGGGPLI
jgi:hypothetical protein